GKRKRMVSLLKPSESASRGAACGCACPSPRRLRWPAPEPGPLLRGAQRLRLLSIVDVGGSPVPLDGLAGLVADRFDAEEEPAIGAVRAAQPCLALAGLALGEDRLPFRGQPLEVVGMHRRLPSPAEAFPGGEARVVLPPPIQESGGAARPGAPGKR